MSITFNFLISQFCMSGMSLIHETQAGWISVVKSLLRKLSRWIKINALHKHDFTVYTNAFSLRFINEALFFYKRTKKHFTGYSSWDVFNMISVGFQTLIVCIWMNGVSCHMGESFDLSFEYGDLVSVQMHVLVNFRSLIYRVHNTLHPICT